MCIYPCWPYRTRVMPAPVVAVVATVRPETNAGYDNGATL
jgi:hypothetical protein